MVKKKKKSRGWWTLIDLFPFLHSFLDVGWQKAQKVENKKHWAKAGFGNLQAEGFSAVCQTKYFHYSKRLDIKSNVLADKKVLFLFCFLKKATESAMVPVN